MADVGRIYLQRPLYFPISLFIMERHCCLYFLVLVSSYFTQVLSGLVIVYAAILLVSLFLVLQYVVIMQLYAEVMLSVTGRIANASLDTSHQVD